MRDERGDMLPNAHLIGFFRRICRLLYHRISPVMVFDGATPALKRRTTAARRRVRENQQGQVRRTAEKLLLNAMKASALKQAMENKNRAGSGAEPGAGPSAHAATDGPSADLENEVDLTNDDDDDDDDEAVPADEDPEWAEASEESEEEEEEEDMFIPDADDIDPEVLLLTAVRADGGDAEDALAARRGEPRTLPEPEREDVTSPRCRWRRTSSPPSSSALWSLSSRPAGEVSEDGSAGGADADAAALTTLGGGAGSAAEPGALAANVSRPIAIAFVFSKPVLERAGGFDAGPGPAGTASVRSGSRTSRTRCSARGRSAAAGRAAAAAAVVSAAGPSARRRNGSCCRP